MPLLSPEEVERLQSLRIGEIHEETFQQRVMELVQDYWPEYTHTQGERGARMLEEALETAQAANVPRELAQALLDRAYDREPGPLNLELGQLVLCVAALAEVEGLNANLLGEAELDRLSAPGMRKRMRARHAEKVRQGISS